MKLSLGFSPCPNDTFIFDAMIHHKIDTEGLEFEVVMQDVEALNQMAFSSDLDITKLSYHAYGWLTSTYALLDSGSALGKNCGPLLIAKAPMSTVQVEQGTIAIPGKYTTANFLLSLAYPRAKKKREMLFSEIEPAVLKGEVACGLIIHENRFTYQAKGLVKIMDLGEYWETTTNLPIPLGGIAIKRTLPTDIQQLVNKVLKRSVAYAMKNPKDSKAFVRLHAQEMSEHVMYQHIALYVNDFTFDLGPEGKKAVETLFHLAMSKNIIPFSKENLFAIS